MPFSFTSLSPGSRLGILNITPDSFSDGGRFLAPDHAVARARQLAGAGACVLDLGAEASSFFRDGIHPTAPAEQLRRLLPVVDALRRALPGIPLSIDTRSAAVADACLRDGAVIINDISAGTHDADMLGTVARHRAAIILMHISAGYPQTAPDDPHILGTVRTWLAARWDAARAAGLTEIALDPGLGFGKSMRDNWTLLTRLDELAPPGVPLVLGASRKRFLETPPPVEIAAKLHKLAKTFPAAEHPRDAMTAAVTAFVGPRARLHRLHAMA